MTRVCRHCGEKVVKDEEFPLLWLHEDGGGLFCTEDGEVIWTKTADAVDKGVAIVRDER